MQNASVGMYFKGQYDTGFQISEFKGELQVIGATGKKFQALICQTEGNWSHCKEKVQHVMVVFRDDAAMVTLTSESTLAPTPFKDRVWNLQRVSHST